MRQRRTTKKSPSVSLFPFLAVLICTMGSLIVLLVMVVHQARVHASMDTHERLQTSEEAQERLEQLRIAREDAQWRRGLLEQQREELVGQAAEQRLQLSHLEEHIRRLTQRWQELQKQAASLKDVQQDRANIEETLRRQITALEQQRRAAEKELEAARTAYAERGRSFALVPYDGPQGTQRRPIYIECTGEAIVLQPEGIHLTPQDFAGPLGPGNPLDASLRAIREHLLRLDPEQRHGEPYPLLIVRPNGAASYAVARAAMKDWEDEFGYELIDADLQLAYPPQDPQLKAVLEQTIADARERQALLAAAMPRKYDDRSIQGFRASSHHGGFVAQQAGAESGFGGWSSEPSEGPDASAKSGPAATARQPHAGSAMRRGPGSAPGTGGGLESLAKTRGSNWALPKASRELTAITRPIRISCEADRLVLLPEPGEHRAPVIVPLDLATADSVDKFLEEIWKRVDSWGLAISGGYWKPILHLEVAPGGERRLADLQVLLADSGIELKRKSR